MKKIFYCFFLAASVFQFASAQKFPDPPNPPRLVNDYAGILSAEEKESLEKKLLIYNDTTSTQIAVVTIQSLNGYPASDYAIQLGEHWGIGQKGRNNGALILVAVEDRETFIATGYGLEGSIPDALAKRIVEQDMIPYFREGNYFKGLDKATDTMIALASGEYTALPRKEKFPWQVLMVIFLMILFFLFRMMSVRNYAHTNSIPFWTAWTLLNAARRSQKGSWGSFSSRGGSFGGGGFGGFGGGSFGGGGAGGRW
jgi:uncharacterized protein